MTIITRAMRLHLLTFNTLGTPFFASNIATRYKKIAEEINKNDIDIVCLQEIFAHYNRYWFDAGLKTFPYKVYQKNLLGVAGGLAIYSKIPLEFSTYYTFQYPKGLFVPPYTSLAKAGILISKLPNRPFFLLTTHLSADTVHDLTPKNRFYELIKCQLEQVEETVEKLSKEGSLILVGDFNISNESQLYKDFIAKTGLTDIFMNDTTPSYAPDRIPYIYTAEKPARIDYIFYKGILKLEIEKKSVQFQNPLQIKGQQEHFLSDHSGLSATLKLI